MLQYQNQRNAYLNQEKWIFPGSGAYDTPQIPPVNVSLDGCQFIRFDAAVKEFHPENKIVHFFTDDYMFDRVWNNPERYLTVLGRFRAVIAPDFSIYSDHPLACRLFNHFRKHWLGAYWAGMGIPVIPCPRWDVEDPTSFEWCLDGDPMYTTICISTHGQIKGNKRKEQFLYGWHETIERLQPSRIILFGDMFPGVEFDGELVHVTNEQMAKKRRYCRRGSRQER